MRMNPIENLFVLSIFFLPIICIDYYYCVYNILLTTIDRKHNKQSNFEYLCSV